MAKVVLKCGDIQIDYDGPEEFLKTELGALVKATLELRAVAKTEHKHGHTGAESASGSGGAGPASVSMIAQKMGANSGSKLIMAAAISLARGGSESFTKKQLRERMRDAKSHYKGSYMNNFDNYMARLSKTGKLNHLGGENYALPAESEAASA
jgi:hypothetical protein